LPYDSGVSAGRNAALERVRTPFFVLCDDDFLLDHRANLALMRSMIMTHNLDVLGGAVYQDGGVDRFSGYLIEEPGSLIRHEPIRYEPPVTLCDTVPNFFIAKTDFARTELHGWNPRLKLCEHAEFFFRAKKIEARVGYSEEFGVLHRKCGESAYFAMRRRNFYQQFFREAGIRAWRRMDGLTISMDEDFNGEVEHGAAAQNGTGRYS
jgi:glycosyltransferase involved in cell wall biosynthesis